MARELGMGVTPWSPLARGVLTGKYKRAEHGKHQANRGERVTAGLSPKTYDLVDGARARGGRASRPRRRASALAWVAGRPGVSSPIIGARTMEQLEDNLARRRTSRSGGPRRAARRGVDADLAVPAHDDGDGARDRERRHEHQRRQGAGVAEHARPTTTSAGSIGRWAPR